MVVAQSEKAIENAIKRYVRDNGGVVFKQHGGGLTEPGRPDLIGGVFGLPFAVETKTLTGVASHAQNFWLKKLREQGFKVGVARSVREFLEVLGVEA